MRPSRPRSRPSDARGRGSAALRIGATALALVLTGPGGAAGDVPQGGPARILAEEEIEAGFTLPIAWIGPGAPDDRLEVGPPGGDATGRVPVGADSPTALRMPAEPGIHELRYVSGRDGAVLATQEIRILPVEAWLFAVPIARAGASVSVEWDGPGYAGDRIAIAGPDAAEAVADTDIAAGDPLRVPVPEAPGSYELRYVLAESDTVIARRPLEVEAAEATLQAVGTARSGAPVVVDWTGPAFPRDHVAVARPWPGAPPWETLTYVRDGSPLIVEMPGWPGEYELRYVSPRLGDAVLARHEIMLTPVGATLTAPDSVPAGRPVAVEWEGPDYRRDFVALARADAADDDPESYAYTSEDSPLILRVPDTPGSYELRYHLGRNGRVLARHAFVATAPPG